MSVFYILQLIIFIPLVLAVAYLLLFAIAGLFYKQPVYADSAIKSRIAVLIPGYKEDEVIVESATVALQQQYPLSLFDVVIIADSFKKETLDQLRQLPVKLVEVSFEKSTKAKALNKGMEAIGDQYDIAVVLDADNIMADDFLYKINAAMANGSVAVQGHRTAKNCETSMAVLDGISEEINNHIFRKGHRALGLSSAIIGSGMAFQYHYFKTMMSHVTAVGGFDKEIELKTLKDKKKIGYLHDAVLYDEKIQQDAGFSNQRRRWLSAQLHYFRAGFPDAVKNLFTKGNIDYFDKAIQFIQPPRILLLAAVFFCAIFFAGINTWRGINTTLSFSWLLLVAATVVVFILSIPLSFYNRQTLTAISKLPKGIWLMLGSLLKIKGANKNFIHTKHSASGTGLTPLKTYKKEV